MEKPNILVATDFSCGGILNSILNNRDIEFSDRFFGSVESIEHTLLKFLKNQNLDHLLEKCFPNVWYTTHETDIDFDKFGKKVIITTESIKSRYIIFIRSFRFLNLKINNDLETIDKAREFAKEYALPKIIYKHDKINSIELCDILNDNHTLFDIENPTWKKWKQKNNYLWEPNHWLESRWHEAIYEATTGSSYKYN